MAVKPYKPCKESVIVEEKSMYQRVQTAEVDERHLASAVTLYHTYFQHISEKFISYCAFSVAENTI